MGLDRKVIRKFSSFISHTRTFTVKLHLKGIKRKKN